MQLLANSILQAAGIVLVGLSFAVIYRTTKFFHFAHAAVYTAAGYFTYALSVWLRLPLALSVPLAVVLSTLLGCVTELILYRPLRHRGASSLVLILTSLGTYVALQNLISLTFGDDVKSIRSKGAQEGLNILGARLTPIQILAIGTSAVLVVAVAILLKRTRLGRAIRAVASDPELAEVSGVERDRTILWAFALGSSLAGVAGILASFDLDMTPTMGMNALMMGVVAAIIGGVGNAPGIALGALLLGLARHLGIWRIGSQWQDAVAFAILFVFLLLRPQGFLGRPVKKATV